MAVQLKDDHLLNPSLTSTIFTGKRDTVNLLETNVSMKHSPRLIQTAIYCSLVETDFALNLHVFFEVLLLVNALTLASALKRQLMRSASTMLTIGREYKHA